MTNPTPHGQVPNKYLTVVYRDIAPGKEARELIEHPKMSASSWSHALNDRDAAIAQVSTLRTAHVQNPAEIEHDAGDVSKNGAGLNMSTQHTRIAELEAQIEALSGVQALSAAPAVHASVKGAMWFTKKPVTIQAIQWTGDNLREVITFTDGPPDTRSHHAGMAWDAYRDLVARDGLKIYTLEGKMLASPGDWIIRGVKGELYPCKPDIFQETYAAASPTPPAEQAAPKAAPGEH